MANFSLILIISCARLKLGIYCFFFVFFLPPPLQAGVSLREPLVRPHDQLSYIASERTFANALNLPVPVSMFMPPIPAHFSNQQQQQQQQAAANAGNNSSRGIKTLMLQPH